MEQRPREAVTILWNLNFHYPVHNSPSLVHILSQMHPVHNFPVYFHKTHFNIIFPSTPRSSEWALPFKCFSLKHFYKVYRAYVQRHDNWAPYHHGLQIWRVIANMLIRIADK